MKSLPLFALATASVLAAAFATPAAALECDAGSRAFTHSAGEVCIPEEPQRIITLNDQILTLPLYELGANVVGSAGRLEADGTPYLRGGMDTLGIDFSNTDLTFVGLFNDLDAEAIAALEPDLIIGGVYNDAAVLEQLGAIAPTLSINNGELGLIETMRTLADATGRAPTFEARYQRYLDNVARLQSYVGEPSDISVALTFMFPQAEALWVYKSGLGAISQVIEDVGFSLPAAVQALDVAQISYSAELIQDLDADFIFGFYRQQPDATPDAIRAAYETFAPGWCQALTACQNGQFVLLPGHIFGSTMASLDLALEMIESHVVGRRFTPLSEAN